MNHPIKQWVDLPAFYAKYHNNGQAPEFLHDNHTRKVKHLPHLVDAKQNFILPMSPIHHPGTKVGRIGVSMDQNDAIAPSLPDFDAFLEGPDSSYHLIIYNDGNLGTTNLIKPNGFELSSISQNRQ